MFTATKIYQDLPAAHRQPGHVGHCRLIHGHNWSFAITFGCVVTDENGFVIDVGELDSVKEFMQSHFDHTLLINHSDPIKDRAGFFSALHDFANVVSVPNCGMEGLAEFVFSSVTLILKNDPKHTGSVSMRGLRVVEVTCWEDSKNRATYRP